MDRVVLCEGKRDVKLIEQYYEQSQGSPELNRVHGENIDHSNLKNRESDAVRNFTERRNPYDILVKSENGVPNLKRLFVKIADFLMKQPEFRVCLLIDLDEKGYDHLDHTSNTRRYRELLSELDTRVGDNYQGKDLKIQQDSIHTRSSVQIAGEATLRSAQGPVGSFDVLAFHSDLEDAAGISDGDEITEDERLGNFLNSDASDPMERIF